MPRQRPIHAGLRAIADLTVGVAKSTEARRRREAELGLTESWQQFHVPLSGSAGTLPSFVYVDVEFDYGFHYAPGQRDSDLERPHFSFGSECDGEVDLGANVSEWNVDSDTGAYLGATVRLSAIAADETSFTGTAHLTFQGFSAPDDVGDVTVEG